MNLFKAFLKLAWKHKYIIFIYLAIYLAFGVIMSSASGFDTEQSAETRKILVTLEDPADAETPAYAAFENHLAERNYENFDAEKYGSTATELLEMQLIDAEVIVHAGLQKNLDNNEELFEVSYATQNMQTYTLYYDLFSFSNFAAGLARADGGFDTDDVDRLDRILAEQSTVKVLRPNETTPYASGMSFFTNLLPYNFMICLIFLLGYVLYDFESPELKRRIKLGSVSNTRWNIETLLGQLVIFAIMLLMGIGMGFLNNDDMGALLPHLWLPLVLFGFSTVTVTNLMIKIFPKGMLAGAGMVYAMGSSFMAGAFFPREMLSDEVLNIAKIFPLYYYINDVEHYALPLRDRLPNLVALFLFGILFLVLAIIIDRIKSQSATLETNKDYN